MPYKDQPDVPTRSKLSYKNLPSTLPLHINTKHSYPLTQTPVPHLQLTIRLMEHYRLYLCLFVSSSLSFSGSGVEFAQAREWRKHCSLLKLRTDMLWQSVVQRLWDAAQYLYYAQSYYYYDYYWVWVWVLLLLGQNIWWKGNIKLFLSFFFN